MKARTWIVIGIVFLVFMTINNAEFYLSIITGDFVKLIPPGADTPAGGIFLIIIVWIPLMLHALSVFVLIKGLKKRRVENSLSTLQFSNTIKDKVEEKENSALEILKKRYASGNISEEEFNKMKENLDKK